MSDYEEWCTKPSYADAVHTYAARALLRCAGKTLLVFLRAERSKAPRTACVNGPLLCFDFCMLSSSSHSAVIVDAHAVCPIFTATRDVISRRLSAAVFDDLFTGVMQSDSTTV